MEGLFGNPNPYNSTYYIFRIYVRARHSAVPFHMESALGLLLDGLEKKVGAYIDVGLSGEVCSSYSNITLGTTCHSTWL